MNIFGLLYIIFGILYLFGCCFEDVGFRRNTIAFSIKIRRKICYKLYKHYIYPEAIKLHYIYVYPQDMITLESEVKIDPYSLLKGYSKNEIALEAVTKCFSNIIEKIKDNLLIIESNDLQRGTPIYKVLIKVPKVQLYTYINGNNKVYKGLNEFIKNLNNSEYDNFYIISNLHNKLKANINC